MELGSESIIRLSNVCDQEIFTYPLILVRGRIWQADDYETISKTRAFVIDEKSSAKIPCRLFNDKFLVLLQLEIGKNEFVFTYGQHSTKKTFFYRIPKRNQKVTPIHIVCENGVTDNESVDIARKINLGAQLIQTLIAESLYSCGFTRRTFLLEQSR